ncbi:uncharacterized protein BDR25DRAFT_268351 [Lindgomyces ingoldianus]|uniref:Uncharacterized protein n=1 Tax=Lindgomyces ingoldianus TaxID=673940 RepID=A0ACB6QIP2_9PLEO|nr:uncharacterized protein BDR25DRAFT_268351 [Lindgomyces ingoldianus]KAF2466824.1 hypothetical protein BDR25DRAFT_268351 [Lindgomyces ingoldianus]
MARKKKCKGPNKAPAKAPRKASRPPCQQVARRQFSMLDEARFTASHTHAFDPDRKLRYLKVNFVNGGMLEGTIKEASPKVTVSSAPPTTESNAMSRLAIKSPSPTLSGSSEDEIVFKGRVPAARIPLATPSTISITMTPEPSASEYSKGPPPTIDEPTLVSQCETDSDTESVIQDIFQKRLGGKSKWEINTTEWVSRSKSGIGWLPVHERPDIDLFLRGEVNPSAATTHDYMPDTQQPEAEIEGGDEAGDIKPVSTFTCRDLGLGADNDWASKSLGKKQQDGNEWDDGMLRDLGDLSTSSDVMDTVERILSSRERKSGMQYLVVYEGSTADDAHWLPTTLLNKPTDLKLIEAFTLEHLSHQRQSNSDTGNSDLGDEDEDEDETETEEDIPLDDEHLARILAKQEKLGLGSDEVLLLGHDDFFNGPGNGLTSPPMLSISRSWKKQQQHVNGSSSLPGLNFPSASVMADVLEADPYNGFDVMDTERPSLKPKKKGRRGQLPPELSDSGLSEHLRNSWEADRTKKRLKKAEREELRKQGLLGRQGKAPDLSVKYDDGFTMAQIVEEIRDFLFSRRSSCSMPPMDATQRAVVHQFAGKIGLTSKSRGSGQDRFTVLSKTLRTKPIDNDMFDSLVEQKRYKVRFQGSLRGTLRKREVKVHQRAFYKDGDTVGASAPELGPENKGRALLEKMGWRKGTALGALDNKGILQPIAHTVKTNKAGLK